MRSVVSSYLISVIFLINDYKLLSMWDMLEILFEYSIDLLAVVPFC